MSAKKLCKAVFTLTSGKSIVYTMTDENVNTVFNDWKQFITTGKVGDSAIIEISKLKDGEIFEKLGIDKTKIDAIQIGNIDFTDKNI
jgi:hypothetical protein